MVGKYVSFNSPEMQMLQSPPLNPIIELFVNDNLLKYNCNCLWISLNKKVKIVESKFILNNKTKKSV
jgi:hypothetical protein